jgi:hypothetical protein
MVHWVSKRFITSVHWLERLLALSILGGIIMYAISSGAILAGMPWGATETLYELLYRVLLMVVGLELVRMLIVHDLAAVLELLAFVIARKVLKPDIEVFDIALAVLAFVALLGARRYFLTPPSHGAPGEDVHAESGPQAGHSLGLR